MNRQHQSSGLNVAVDDDHDNDGDDKKEDEDHGDGGVPLSDSFSQLVFSEQSCVSSCCRGSKKVDGRS